MHGTATSVLCIAQCFRRWCFLSQQLPSIICFLDRKMLIMLAPNTSLCSLLALKEMRLSGPCPGHNSRDVRSAACACRPWYVRGAHMRACTRARLLVRLSLCPAVCFCLARPCAAVVLHPVCRFVFLLPSPFLETCSRSSSHKTWPPCFR